MVEVYPSLKPIPERANFSSLNTRLIHIPTYGRQIMTSWPDMQPMAHNLVNYGTTDNGIAIIELCSDSAGEPLTEGKTPVNTYTHSMMRDIDQAVLKARFDDDVTVIILTGFGEKFFSAGASISMLDSVSPGSVSYTHLTLPTKA